MKEIEKLNIEKFDMQIRKIEEKINEIIDAVNEIIKLTPPSNLHVED